MSGDGEAAIDAASDVKKAPARRHRPADAPAAPTGEELEEAEPPAEAEDAAPATKPKARVKAKTKIKAKAKADQKAKKKRARDEDATAIAITPATVVAPPDGADGKAEVESVKPVRATKRARAAAPVPAADASSEETDTLLSRVVGTLDRRGCLLTDETINALGGRLVDANTSRGRVVFVSSLAMSAAVSANFYRADEMTRESMLRCLGVDADALSRAEAILIPIHGPYRMETLQADRIYGDSDHPALAQNHWSLLCWFRGSDCLYHYDSMNGLNKAAALEAAGILCSTRYSILPLDTGNTVMIDPEHVPVQTDQWECGYYILLFTKIIADKTGLTTRNITEYDVDTIYAQRISTMCAEPLSPFARYLKTLVVNYDVFA